MSIPLRAGPEALAVSYDLDELAAVHPDVNRVLEEAWGSLLVILVERWPDWPVEVWSRLSVVPADDGNVTWGLQYRVFFAGEGPGSREVAAMAGFVVQGLTGLVQVEPKLGWGTVDATWSALWAIDDGKVFRLLVPEHTIDDAIHQIGHYAGAPSYFAASVEGWALSSAEVGIELAAPDLGWAFDR